MQSLVLFTLAVLSFAYYSEGACPATSNYTNGGSFNVTIPTNTSIGTRFFTLHLPAGYGNASFNVRRPLVLNFHAYGSNEQQQVNWSLTLLIVRRNL